MHTGDHFPFRRNILEQCLPCPDRCNGIGIVFDRDFRMAELDDMAVDDVAPDQKRLAV